MEMPGSGRYRRNPAVSTVSAKIYGERSPTGRERERETRREKERETFWPKTPIPGRTRGRKNPDLFPPKRTFVSLRRRRRRRRLSLSLSLSLFASFRE